MYGELTEKETVARIEYALENQQLDQFEILLYKKNSNFTFFYVIFIFAHKKFTFTFRNTIMAFITNCTN